MTSGLGKLFNYAIHPEPQIMLAHEINNTTYQLTPILLRRPSQGWQLDETQCNVCGQILIVKIAAEPTATMYLWLWRLLFVSFVVAMLSVSIAAATKNLPEWAFIPAVMLGISSAYFVNRLEDEDGIRLEGATEVHELKYPQR